MRPQLDAHLILPLEGGWYLASSASGTYETPEAFLASESLWREAVVPGTVGQSLGADLAGRHSFDEQEWWYRCTFERMNEHEGRTHHLHFEGLATFADVWLNGTPILNARNMFRSYDCEVTSLLRASNELVIRFRALTQEMAAKKPRPRWKTALVSAQFLRGVRTTLLGRMPGWTPALPPVGPWKGIRLESRKGVEVASCHLHTSAEGETGLLHLRVAVKGHVSSAKLHVGERSFDAGVEVREGLTHLTCDLRIPGIPLWFPHTHGTPQLVPCRLELSTSVGPVRMNVGPVGFKSVEVDRSGGRVRLHINGRPIFCRGACWTVNDIRSLAGTDAQLRQALELAKAAGANMIRVGGTMVYESDAFYALCDALGLMVWQDFMFANMDYPFDDPAFRAEVEAEVEEQLKRLSPHPCLTVYCGGSEIQQQAAMLGLPPEQWSHAFLAEELPRRCETLHPGIPYFPSSPCEGALPFHTATGITHYYGVGAYVRPLSDVKSAKVKFASECLAFSQVPVEEAFDEISDGGMPVPHHPQWKAGVPRDHGSGWDFEDVRDHYLKTLYHVDPIALRSHDLDRYFALSRAVTGEVMAKTFAVWRTDGLCGGGLVWFYQDLRPGAGWGVLDSRLRPKPAYWHLRRAWASRAVFLTDEGLDGLNLHAINETDRPLQARIEVEALQHGHLRVGFGELSTTLPPFDRAQWAADAVLGHFLDLTYAYRFGPPKCDVVVARLRDASSNEVLSEDVFFPLGHGLPVQSQLEVDATLKAEVSGQVSMTLLSPVFLQSVSLTSKDHIPSDNHFHLTPGQPRSLTWTPKGDPARPFKAHMSALNIREGWTLRL